jgi:hypothetical protein
MRNWPRFSADLAASVDKDGRRGPRREAVGEQAIGHQAVPELAGAKILIVDDDIRNILFADQRAQSARRRSASRRARARTAS